jgi:ABC-type Fe3+-siderophore transport system permease subunit
MNRWGLATAVFAVVLYAAALSNQVYDLTSPPFLSWHVALRKAYSVVAFALLAFTLRRSLRSAGPARVCLTCVLGVAAFSALIEVGQYIEGSQEGLAWNIIDALGGALAVSDLLIRKRSRTGNG